MLPAPSGFAFLAAGVGGRVLLQLWGHSSFCCRCGGAFAYLLWALASSLTHREAKATAVITHNKRQTGAGHPFGPAKTKGTRP